MSADAQPVIESEAAAHSPLVLRIKLPQADLTIGKVPGFRFGVIIEITKQRVCISEVCISRAEIAGSRNGEPVAGAVSKIQPTRPLSAAGCFAIEQPLKIG